MALRRAVVVAQQLPMELAVLLLGGTVGLVRAAVEVRVDMPVRTVRIPSPRVEMAARLSACTQRQPSVRHRAAHNASTAGALIQPLMPV